MTAVMGVVLPVCDLRVRHEATACSGGFGGSMKRTIVWKRVDTTGLEYADVTLSPLSIDGEVVVIEGGVPFAVSYRVTCDAGGATERAAVRLRCAGAESEHLLVRGAAGAWTLNGTPQPQLEGLMDVDLSVTPSTNTPPLRRLRLGVGQRAEVTAAWVRFPSLNVVPLRQIYRRVSATTYAYEAPDLHFDAELDCDEDGIVRTYSGLWTRW
jgi:hypothetical protein